jgi:hypothetical protein
VDCLLEVAFSKLAFPDCGASDLAALAYKDVARGKTEPIRIFGPKIHRWQIANVDVPPLHVAVSQIRSRVSTRLAAC